MPRRRTRTGNSGPQPAPPPDPQLVFVYGTLMRGGRLHKHLLRSGADYMGRASMRGRLYSLQGLYYPAAVPAGGADELVHGELYRLADARKALSVLDRVEGCDEGLFRRRAVSVWTGTGHAKAWAYFYARPLGRARIIPTGSYRHRRAV